MRPRLVLYLACVDDLARFAIAPTLAALVAQAGGGWRFDCAFDALRDGKHFGAGDPRESGPSAGNGSLLAGSVHAEQLLALTIHYEVIAVGDGRSALWPLLKAAGVEVLCTEADPATIYRATLDRLRRDGTVRTPQRLIVVDGQPQGLHGLIVAPYLLPAAFIDGPSLLIDVDSDRRQVEAVTNLLGTPSAPPLALYVDPTRADAFPLELEWREGMVGEATYADITVELAHRHSAWGTGLLLGDPDLVASQAARSSRLRLLPVHGRPQVDAVTRLNDLARNATEPVYGRQWDDRDFFALAKAGRGLQVVDPPPPFDAVSGIPPVWGEGVAARCEPDDDQLRRWADDGRVLTTLLFWVGMIREVDCYPALLDLVAGTGLSIGAIVTVDAVAHAPRSALALMTTPPARGGVQGLVELLVGSTGFGVAAEAELPEGVLEQSLADALRQLDGLLPEALRPRGWWPLLDTTLRPHAVRPVGMRSGRPLLRLRPGRSVARAVVNRTRGYRWAEDQRPYDAVRPDAPVPEVARAVRRAGFHHMWTKASFGSSRAVQADGGFVALPFTAGNWDGWSPFYTVSSVADVLAAERRLTARNAPGWLVSTVDSPLWLLTGERLRHSSWLHEAMTTLAGGGRTGRLVNVAPSVIARYAQLLEERSSPP